MRLSPKSIFFGLVALGLPVAVTIGWQLATPPTRSAAVDTPGGAGGIGDAPARPRLSAPPPATSSATATRPVAASGSPSVTPVATRAAGVPARTLPATPSAPPTEASANPLPSLTDPPVPTPTDVTEAPTTPPTSSPPAAPADPPAPGQ